MKKKHVFIALALLTATMGCKYNPAEAEGEPLPQIASYEAVNDSLCYGFACDGCSDSVVVFLPDSISDPVSYDIMRAFRRHQVYGNPSVGDKLALYLSPDGKEVLQVVDIDALKGTWVYQVYPQPRVRHHTNEDGEEVKLTEDEQHAIDSMLQTYMKPREYGFTLKRDFTSQSVGGPPRQTSLDEELPVVYPPLKRYSEWHLWNGKLILTSRSRRQQGDTAQHVPAQVKNDTVELVMMRRDTLVLRFDDHERKFSRKPDSLMVK